jgi:hypothetical protein
MSDLNLPLRTLKPGSELPIQVPLGIADRPVSGYTSRSSTPDARPGSARPAPFFPLETPCRH